MSEVKTILKDYKLRQTDCREEILQVFMSKPHALAHADVEGQLTEQFDRVSVYRTLKTFLDKGIIHKVLDDEGGVTLAYNPHQASIFWTEENGMKIKGDTDAE